MYRLELTAPSARFFYAYIFIYTKFVNMHKLCIFTIVNKKNKRYEKSNSKSSTKNGSRS